jgi:hypothetical protein
MIIALIFSIFLNILCTCAVNNENSSSLIGFFPLYERLRQDTSWAVITFASSLSYVQFVIEYYRAEPEKCLREAFKINDRHFAELFFDILSSQKNEEYYMARNSDPIVCSIDIRCNIESLVRNVLFEPYDSLKELQEKIVVINLLIEFFKRYLDPSYYVPAFKSISLQQDSKEIERWEQAIDFLLHNSQQGEIDYNFLVSFVPWPNGSNDLEFPSQPEDKFDRYSLIFFSYIHYIIRGKDHRVFDFNHPDLVFLMALILDNIDDLGNCLFPCDDEWQSYCKLKEFFVREKNPFVLLKEIVIRKKEIYTVAKAKLAIIGAPHCIFCLYDFFEKSFGKDPNDENRNILFQLKCLSHLEVYLNRKHYCNQVFI